VFIGTTSGRSSGYKPALQAPVRVRHVAPANHRISSLSLSLSLSQDMVESVLFPVPSGHSGTFAATWTRYRRHDLSPRSRRLWPWHAAFDLRVTSSIDLPTAQNVTSRIESLRLNLVIRAWYEDEPSSIVLTDRLDRKCTLKFCFAFATTVRETQLTRAVARHLYFLLQTHTRAIA